jgi:hypothetical protein
MPLVRSFFDTNSRGEFSLFDLSLTLLNSPKDPDFAAIRKLSTEKERLDEWLGATAFFHEMRHYHDLVGSPSGLAVFLEVTRLVDDLLTALKENSGKNLAPILVRAPDSAPARLYVERQKFFEAALGERITLASEEESEARGYKVSEFTSESLGVSTFFPLVPIPDFDPVTGEEHERLVPLGLRALMEHSAYEIQMFLAVIGAGADPHDLQDMRGRAQRVFECHAKLVRGGFPPAYYLARQMAHYHAITLDRTRPATDLRFFPALASLMPFVQAALDIGGYSPISTDCGIRWEFEHPGQAYAHLLKHWSNHDLSFEKGLERADRAVSEFLPTSWREYLQRYVAQMDRAPRALIPPNLAPEAARHPLIANIRQAVLDDHVAIMRSKAQDLLTWLNPVAYIKALGRLPRPPLIIDGVSSANVASSQTGALFLNWSILLAVLEGIMETGIVNCPVALRMQPAARLFEFPSPENPNLATKCDSFIAEKLCGTYAGSFMPGQPLACPFANLIQKIFLLPSIDIQFPEQHHA